MNAFIIHLNEIFKLNGFHVYLPLNCAVNKVFFLKSRQTISNASKPSIYSHITIVFPKIESNKDGAERNCVKEAKQKYIINPS